jgi:hypothetical protein
MPLLVRTPDNSVIDAQLRAVGIDPNRISAIPWLDISDREAREVVEKLYLAEGGIDDYRGAVSRTSQMQYDYASPVAVGDAVFNDTSQTITRRIGGEITVGTTTSFTFSASAEASMFNLVKFSISASYGQEWRREEKFSDYLDIPIPPGSTVWLERETVMRRIEGPWIGVMFAVNHRWEGSILSPGVEGSLQHRVSVREQTGVGADLRAMLTGLSPADAQRAGILSNGDTGVYRLPATMAALGLFGDRVTARRTDRRDLVPVPA